MPPDILPFPALGSRHPHRPLNSSHSGLTNFHQTYSARFHPCSFAHKHVLVRKLTLTISFPSLPLVPAHAVPPSSRVCLGPATQGTALL